jgi:hypothetical protein
VVIVFIASAERCRGRIDRRASIIGDDVLQQNVALMRETLSRIDTEGHAAVHRVGEDQADSIRFVHAAPDDRDPDRWFEVEQLRPDTWVFRRPADELRRHPSILSEIRPTWFVYARVAADLAVAARDSAENARSYRQGGIELRVRLPHCLPIDLVGGLGGWERRPRTAGDP